MRIGLYSKLARQDIDRARAFIAERDYGSSEEDVPALPPRARKRLVTKCATVECREPASIFSAPAAAVICCSMFKNINLRCQRSLTFSAKTNSPNF